MKKAIQHFSLVLIALCNSINAQMPSCQWAHNSIGTGAQYMGASSATDLNGNLIVVGNFDSPSIVFGTSTLINNSYASPNSDIFIVKYSPSGTVIWANSYGGTGDDPSAHVATDASGNIFITGYFNSPTIAFGTITITNNNVGSGYRNYFIAKFSPSGTALWASSAGGIAGNIVGSNLTTDASGNVFVNGYYSCANITLGTTTLTNTGSRNNMFIAKYASTGTVLWASSASGADTDYGSEVTTDASGNVFFAGVYSGSNIVVGTTTITSSIWTCNNMFVVKYSSSGAIQWSRSIISNSSSGVDAISTDPNGNLIVAGYFFGTFISFGTTTITGRAAQNSDIYMVKYSPSGNVLWANSISSLDYGYAYGICTDTAGNIFLTGYFGSQSITFGNTVLANTFIGTNDIFIAKYSPLGTVVWANALGGANQDRCFTVSNDLSGNIFLSGVFNSPALTFGNTSITNNARGSYNVFVAKLGDGLTGIRETQQIKTQLSIYPNPFSSQTTISFSEAQSNTTVKIIDILGHEVMVIPNVTGTELLIEKGTLQAGIYFVQIMDDKNKYPSKKIILQ